MGFLIFEITENCILKQTILARFDIRGNLKYLSHAEAVSVLQRACVRAGVEVGYSRGFNPRVKLSLPLPRSVGCEAQDELAVIGAECKDKIDAAKLKSDLAEQLPGGFELTTVDIFEGKVKAAARSAVYEICAGVSEKKIKEILASEELVVERRINAKGDTKQIDVRRYIDSVELTDKGVRAKCFITPDGTVRVDEIIKLLGIDEASGVKRTSVEWQMN